MGQFLEHFTCRKNSCCCTTLACRMLCWNDCQQVLKIAKRCRHSTWKHKSFVGNIVWTLELARYRTLRVKRWSRPLLVCVITVVSINDWTIKLLKTLCLQQRVRVGTPTKNIPWASAGWYISAASNNWNLAWTKQTILGRELPSTVKRKSWYKKSDLSSLLPCVEILWIYCSTILPLCAIEH